jgi:trk system potassium uptake protein
MASVITLGTTLLALPIATVNPVSLLDLFFTATSATCVCSQLTIPLSHFSTFGKTVILMLIQIGGIGVMTLSIVFMSMFLDLGLTTQLMAGKFLEMEGHSKSKQILRFIFSSTLLIEVIGALLILIVVPGFTIFEALFHSISSFCNAGFSLTPHLLENFSNNYKMLAITMTLITLGGLGFVVLYELLTYPFQKKRPQLSLHTKTVLVSAIVIIIFGTLSFLTIQYDSLSIHNLINSLFNAISIRSTGYLTIPVFSIVLPIYLLIMIISFIGSAPGSTGSGIKTTAFFISFAAAKAVLMGKKNVQLFGREINIGQIQKVLAILILSFSWILLSTFTLLISEGSGFLITLFESVSSFCNLGLTIGLTSHLSDFGKIITIISIIMGRVGPITLALAFASKRETKTISYPEEKLMLS